MQMMTNVPADAVTAPPPEPAAWLPLTVADRADAATYDEDAADPEHGWPGKLFLFLANLTGLGLGVGAVAVPLIVVFTRPANALENLGFGALLAIGSIIQLSIAKHVGRFSTWAWYGVMAELALSVVSQAYTGREWMQVAGVSVGAGAGAGITLQLVWIYYFWKRRADFGVDFG
jgi:hypothetical protein